MIHVTKVTAASSSMRYPKSEVASQVKAGESKVSQICKLFKQGRCDRGDNRRFLHRVSQAHLLHQTLNLGEARGIRADIETERRITRRERKDASPPGLSLVVPRVVAARRVAKGLRQGYSPTFNPSRRLPPRSYAGWFGASGRCIIFRPGLPDHLHHSSVLAYPALAAVSFNHVPEYMKVPIGDYGDYELTKVGENPRYYEKTFPLGYKPPKCHQSLTDAQVPAKMRRVTIVQRSPRVPAKSKYECDAEFGCKHCNPPT